MVFIGKNLTASLPVSDYNTNITTNKKQIPHPPKGGGLRNDAFETIGSGIAEISRCTTKAYARSEKIPHPQKSRVRNDTRNLVLLSDDLGFDLLVGGQGDNFLAGQVGFLGVGAAGDDFLGVGVADAGEGF